MKLSLKKDLAKEKAEAAAAIEAAFAARAAALLVLAAPVQALKAAEADRILAGTVKSSPLLKREAKLRGITENALAKLIRGKRDQQLANVEAVEFARQEAQAALDAAETGAAVEAVVAGAV